MQILTILYVPIIFVIFGYIFYFLFSFLVPTLMTRKGTRAGSPVAGDLSFLFNETIV